MARDYIRPEITASDFKLFQAGKCIMINPSKSDVARALKKTEKGCSRNKLPLQEAQAAWQAVNEQQSNTAGAGQWTCSKRSKYSLQGTVLQVVRLTDDLVGLYCDRQEVKPGKSSYYPVKVYDEKTRRVNSILWLSTVLHVFWMNLADEEIDHIERDFVYTVMANEALFGAGVSTSSSKKLNRRKAELRRNMLDVLFRGTSPKFVSEYQQNCLRIAQELRNDGKQSITWSQFKKKEPSIVAKYQPELLTLVEHNQLNIEQLESIKIETSYVLSFSLWTGMQRLFNEPQIALAMRNPGLHREFSNRGGSYKEVSDQLKKAAGFTQHPGTATTIGWLRVHVDDENKLCFIDEVQSDTLEAAREIDNDAARAFLKQSSDWHIHGFATLYHWARDIGYRVAIHSRESAAEKPGMTLSERKWNTYYRPIIKRFKLQSESVKSYPAKIWIQPEA